MIDRLDSRQFSLCCMTVLAALLPHATWLPKPLFFVLVLLIGLRWWQRSRWPRPWPWWFKTGLMLCLFVAAWLSIGTISGHQGAGFLAAMLVSKLYEAERARDARSVATFAAFLVMAHFLFQSELWTLFTALLGAALAVATLASLHRSPGPAATAFAPALRQAGILLIVAVPLAAVLFVLLPRLSEPMWGNTFSTRGGMGLSDRMEPGQLGVAALDDRTAMRVRFPDGVPPPALRYFRGLSLWNTDGRVWTRPDWTQAPMRDLPPVPDRGIRHEITLESDAAPWLPALDRAIMAPDPLHLSIDHSLPMPRRNRPQRYEVVSDPDLALEPFDLIPQLRELALRLPEQRNPRTLALAEQMRARHPSDEAYAEALLRLFADDFVYVLEPPPLGMHAVDEFLFDTQMGYCEHYAAAFATLLRAGGVPARVVLGFQGGYYNQAGDYLVVRRSDAHAWVELWLEGRGWLRTDPTGMVAPERIRRDESTRQAGELGLVSFDGWRWLRDRWDFLEMRWTDWIINYRSSDQSALLQRLLAWLPNTPGLLFTLLALAVVAPLALMLWLLRGPRARTASARDPLARWLQHLRRILGGAGVPSPASEPVSQLVARASERYPALAGDLHALTCRYQSLRYAGLKDPPAPPNRRDLVILWLRLRWLRPSTASSGSAPVPARWSMASAEEQRR